MTTVQEDQVLAEMAWLTDRLLTHKHLMPNGLAVMLRACKSALAQRPDETRAPFGPSHRYAQVAGQIEQRILDGEWKPGQRIPPVHAFTKTYGASERTVARAIHTLALKDVLTLERGAYYVTARG